MNQDRLELGVHSIILKSSRRVIDLEDTLVCKQSRHSIVALHEANEDIGYKTLKIGHMFIFSTNIFEERNEKR